MSVLQCRRISDITITTEPRRITPTPDDCLLAVLLRMVLEHCTNDKGVLDSWALPANGEAMRLLAEAGFIDIDTDIGGRLRATVLPAAGAFLARMGKPSA